MRIDSSQSILFGVALSDFILNEMSQSENGTDLLDLSDMMLEILTKIESDNLVDMKNSLETADSLLDFVFLVYLYQDDIANLAQLIKNSYQYNEELAARLGIVSLSNCILNNVPIESYFALIWDFSSGISDNYGMTIRKIGHVLGWGSEIHAMRHIGKGETPQEIVTLALYSILRHPNSYVSAVQCAMKASKNSEIIGQIVAALIGAKLGVDNLPQTWVNHCQNRKYILKLAQDMTTKRQNYAK